MNMMAGGLIPTGNRPSTPSRGTGRLRHGRRCGPSVATLTGRAEAVTRSRSRFLSATSRIPDDETQPAGPEQSHGEPAAEMVIDSAVEFSVELLTPPYVRDVNESAELA